jgi:hypothetical protein
VILRVKRLTYRKIIKDLSCESPKKISAIKAVRADTKCGLREAKEAVELLMYEKGYTHNKIVTEHRLHVGPSIKRIIVDYGSGDIEVDIESMELKALCELQTIGIEACADILNLVSVLRAYENGSEIYANEKVNES